MQIKALPLVGCDKRVVTCTNTFRVDLSILGASAVPSAVLI